MQKEVRIDLLLNDILDKCILSQNIIQSYSKNEFLSNQLAQLAVERCLEIISIRTNFYINSLQNRKSSSHISSILSNVSKWSRKINHNYQKLPADTLWETVNEINTLEAFIRDLLRNSNSDRVIPHRDSHTVFVLNSGENVALTPTYLEDYVVPYLAAIEDLQRIIDKINGKPTTKIEIEFIRKYNPYTVGMVGEGIKVIEFIRELIIPWRRENAKINAQLDIEKKESEIKLNKIEEENKKLQLIDLQMDLVIKFAEKIAPHLNEKDKMKTMIELLDPIKEIASSPLALESINETNENK